MTLNFKNIDLAIESFYNLLPYGDFFSEIVEPLNIDYKERDIIEKYLVDNQIITDYTNEYDGRFILTDKGQEIYKVYGGVEKYNEYKKEKQEEKLRLEKKASDKLHDDAKLSKWQVKVFWPVFMFGIFSFIFGLYNFITQIEDSRKTKELQIELKNTQEEVSRLRTLVLSPKTVDSLHNAKTQVDVPMPR
mgnify:FL=1